MTGFNAESDEHSYGGSFLETEGEYVMHVFKAERKTSRKGDAMMKVSCVVLLGPEEEKTVKRTLMLEGGGTGWTADLFKSCKSKGVADIYDDEEISREIGNKPFRGVCKMGRPFTGNDGKERQFMEIEDFKPISQADWQQLQRKGYRPGTNDNIFVTGDGGGGSPPSDQNWGGGGYAPPPGDDDIPF